MNRRRFLNSLALITCTPALAIHAGKPIKIKDILIYRLSATRNIEKGYRWQHQVQPLHIYPEYRPLPFEQKSPGEGGTSTYSANYLHILTDSGPEGVYGPIDEEAVIVVNRQLKPFLIGQDPLAIEELWDKMYRLNRHSRAGHFMMGISAVDNALWDLRGKYFGVPVYRLLGGSAREAVDVYGSCLGYSVEPDAVRQKCIELKEQGYVRQKWFLAYGPSDGPEGMVKNVQLVKNLRESLGGKADIFFDAYMGWDLNYAVLWAKQVEKYRPGWIEEAFSPEKLSSFVELSRKTSIPVATGEHFYGRWEVERFLDAGAIKVVQADPEWCGGVSELVKIVTLASANDVHVIPHGHNLHAALHVIASQSPMTCPYGEYLIQKMEQYYMFEKCQLLPVNGQIQLCDQPGFGIEFENSVIEQKKLIES
ncbi:mandelate racemase [candidate division KSB1 bacterium]|nr:mandelate racemase [candidate division KSB1 bacterium]